MTSVRVAFVVHDLLRRGHASPRAVRGPALRPGPRSPGRGSRPPYDVISPEQRALQARSPYNSVRMELPDAPAGVDPYQAAAQRIVDWEAEGVLLRDAVPSLSRAGSAFGPVEPNVVAGQAVQPDEQQPSPGGPLQKPRV